MTKEIQFDYTIDGVDGVLVYTVSDSAVISANDAEYDAEQASIAIGTYPPIFRETVDYVLSQEDKR